MKEKKESRATLVTKGKKEKKMRRTKTTDTEKRRDEKDIKLTHKQDVRNVVNTILYENLCQPKGLNTLLTSPPVYGNGRIHSLDVEICSVDTHFLERCYDKDTNGKRAFVRARIPFYYSHSAPYLYKGIKFEVMKLYNGNYKISLLASAFESYKKMLKFFRLLTAGHLKRCFVTRVDVSILFPSDIYPVDLFFRSVYFKHKRPSTIYVSKDVTKGFVSGFKIGGRPHKMIAYDIDSKPKSKRIGYPPGHINFEILFGKDKLEGLGIRCILDLTNIMKFMPYERVAFRDVFDLEKHKELSKVDSRRLEMIQRYSESTGYQNARKRIHKETKNFYRDYEHLTPDLRVSNKRIKLKKILIHSFYRGVKKWLEIE